MENPVTYATLTAALPKLGFDQAAAEYHGALCGALCVHRADEVDVLQVLEPVEDDGHDPEAGALLNHLRDIVLAGLSNTESPPQLMLPDDSLPLGQRAAALGEWCQGFLLGLASRPGLNLRQASAEAREIVEDLTQFTGMSFEDGQDEEAQETAYAELVEYVRVGAQLLFLELTPAPNKSVH